MTAATRRVDAVACAHQVSHVRSMCSRHVIGATQQQGQICKASSLDGLQAAAGAMTTAMGACEVLQV